MILVSIFPNVSISLPGCVVQINVAGSDCGWNEAKLGMSEIGDSIVFDCLQKNSDGKALQQEER